MKMSGLIPITPQMTCASPCLAQPQTCLDTPMLVFSLGLNTYTFFCVAQTLLMTLHSHVSYIQLGTTPHLSTSVCLVCDLPFHI